ncbi:MAG: histidinol-phosphate transaminase [Bacteroidota bacterium]
MEKHFDIERLVRNNVRALQPYASARDEYVSDGSEMVFLDANENPFESGLNRYPDPHQRALKTVLALKKGVSEDQILIGNGSDEVLDLIFRAFCEPNRDNVITLPPTYGMYGVLANINAVANRKVALTKYFEINAPLVLQNVDESTKVIFLCSPNNPTGNTFSENHIETVLLGFSGLVVIDEAYIDFSNKESWSKRLQGFPNLIVTQTLSKAYGLAGIRLGTCYASKPIIDILKKIKPPYNINELTQRHALKAIGNHEKLQKQVDAIIEQRNIILGQLKQVPCIENVFATDANFVLVKVDDADLRYQQLIERGIVVRNRSNQPLCEQTLRLTIGTENENKNLLQNLNEL